MNPLQPALFFTYCSLLLRKNYSFIENSKSSITDTSSAMLLQK